MAEVLISITAKDGTQQVFRAVEEGGKSAFDMVGNSAAAAAEKTQSVWDRCKTHWVAAMGVMYAAWQTVSKAIDFIKLGAQAMQAEEAFKNVTAAYGEDADDLLAKMKQVSAGIIDDSDLMQRAIKGIQQGLSGKQLVSLLEVARSSARVAGIDIASAFDRITEATANQMTRGLKSLGIVVDQNKAYEEHARKLGVSKDALTEMQQSQALANAAIEEGRRQMQAMGEMTENVAEKIQKAEAHMHETKELIGKGFVFSLYAAVGALFMLGSAIDRVAASLLLPLELIDRFSQKLGINARLWIDLREQMLGSAKISDKTAAEMFEAAMLIAKGGNEASEGIKGIAKEQKDAAAQALVLENAAKKQSGGISAATNALQKYSDVIKTIGMDTLKFANESFTESLKKQSEGIEKLISQSAADWGLGKYDDALKSLSQIEISRKPLDDYLRAINAVYAKQINMQQGIRSQMESQKSALEGALSSSSKLASEMPSAVEHITGRIIQQDIKITESHKAMLESRLAAEKTFYGQAEALHKKSIDSQVQLEQQRMQLQQQMRQSAMTAEDAILGIKQKSMNEEERYYSSVGNLEEKFRSAVKLSGQEKINMLQSLIPAWSGLSDEIQKTETVFAGTQYAETRTRIILSASEAQGRAMSNIRDIAREIAAEQGKQGKAIEDAASAWKKVENATSEAMAKAKETMELYQSKIADLSNDLADMQKRFELYIDISQPRAAIQELKDSLAGIGNPTITVGVNTARSTVVSSSSSELSNLYQQLLANPNNQALADYASTVDWSSGSYASGTSYVPATGSYQLHRGETVLNRSESANYDQRRYANNITFAPNITIKGGDKDPRQIAREIAKPLRDELKRLESMN